VEVDVGPGEGRGDLAGGRVVGVGLVASEAIERGAGVLRAGEAADGGPEFAPGRGQGDDLAPPAGQSGGGRQAVGQVVDRGGPAGRADPRDDQVGPLVDGERPGLVDGGDPGGPDGRLQPGHDPGDPPRARQDARVELAAEQPAHLGRLLERRAWLVGVDGLLGGERAVPGQGLAVAQRRIDCRPRAAIAEGRVVGEVADRDHDVGVGHEPVEVDPPALRRAGQVGDLGRVVGVVDLPGHADGGRGGGRGGRDHGDRLDLRPPEDGRQLGQDRVGGRQGGVERDHHAVAGDDRGGERREVARGFERGADEVRGVRRRGGRRPVPVGDHPIVVDLEVEAFIAVADRDPHARPPLDPPGLAELRFRPSRTVMIGRPTPPGQARRSDPTGPVAPASRG